MRWRLEAPGSLTRKRSLQLPRRLRGLPTRQAVTEDGPHSQTELVLSLPDFDRCRPRRPCPRRARSTGIQRSPPDNSGRSGDALSCAIGVASGLNGVPGHAFQARDRWGHIGATSGPRATGSQRTTTVINGPPSAQLNHQMRVGVAGRLDPRRSLARRKPGVQIRSPSGLPRGRHAV
jgi:hypothetical protein